MKTTSLAFSLAVKVVAELITSSTTFGLLNLFHPEPVETDTRL
jgi:hypothetical protein